MVERIFSWCLRQLSLMRTAVGMLAVVAFCSMLGTWVVQGLPLQDYVAQYGVFGGQVVWYLGVGDVYRAPWFLGLLAVLVASVCTCLTRNGPSIWRHLRGSLGPNVRSAVQVVVTEKRLRDAGFWRLGERDGYVLWERGRLNRLGYFLVHGGVVGIAIAGLMTGFLGWRGNLNLREGETDKVVLVWNGVKAEPKFLPFDVTNEGFEIAFYDSGMPSGYATELRMAGRERVQRVEVNKPLSVGKYTFYQASFGDGGSQVSGEGIDLKTGYGSAFAGKIYEKAQLDDGTRVELLDGRLNTVETGEGAPHDVGPSVDYLVQPPDAPARQLRAYRDLPEVIGVADGTSMKGGSQAVVYRPMDIRGYVNVLKNIGPHGDDVSDDEAVRSAIAGRVKSLTGEEKMLEALRLWQVHRMVQELDIRYVLQVKDFELARYSGLMVAYDPGVWLFWPSAFLGVLGVVLMMGRRLVRVWVKSGKGYITSPHGAKVVGDVQKELDSNKP